MDRRTFIGFIPAIALFGCASQGQDKDDQSGMRFSEAERKIIMGYYPRPVNAQANAKGRVSVGDKLMSGERPNKLPTSLDAQLPTLAAPYARLTLGADVILVNRDTHDILDVIPQVAF
ncbi:MAG: hypothetical protein Q8Q28_15655 [Pseudomonadota bacterium]|nr:hypothetical protein [Pseudomonadota bacterium]